MSSPDPMSSPDRQSPSKTPTTLHVRDGMLRDVEQLVEFNMQLAWETESRKLDRGVLADGIGAALIHPERARYFVVEASGVAVGQAMVSYEWSDWRNAMFWWLQSVFVDPAWRRRGALRALFDHIRAEALRSGEAVCGLRLYVAQQNELAMEIYRALGLTPSSYVMYELDGPSEQPSPKT